MIIAHNILAANSQRMLGLTRTDKAKSTEKLSSGYRINRAADDAASLAISEKMRRQIRGLTQGVQNTMEGIGYLQVADGALNEVHDILHRMTELSVKAANDTNTPEDRAYIQDEMTSLVAEIDRISDTTTFNQQPIFKGADRIITNPDGTPASNSSLSIDDFQMADLSLGYTPFSAGDKGGKLNLQAIVNNPDLAAHGTTYNLIYGSGSTSYPSVRLTKDGNTTEIPVFNMTPTSVTRNSDNTWTRTFNYTDENGTDISINQKIVVDNDNKHYAINGSVTANDGNTFDGDVEVMFHADTAYNNDDQCEGYFIDGQRVQKTSFYDSSLASSTDTIKNTIPSSFSIVDQDNALAFSEKISFTSNPDKLSIGLYYSNGIWPHIDNPASITGTAAARADLGFAAVWKGSFADGGTGVTYGLNYGIAAVETDPDLPAGQITRSDDAITEHEDGKRLWIQSGADKDSGLFIELKEMNSHLLGVENPDVTTQAEASRTIEKIKGALSYVSGLRSDAGAQQNRLEHIVRNENNVVENTQAAESLIRDTDMAEEMVKFSNHNILEQAGMSMLSQANQTAQGVLSLLS